jgi:uncharacterized protein (DUF885 family)
MKTRAETWSVALVLLLLAGFCAAPGLARDATRGGIADFAQLVSGADPGLAPLIELYQTDRGYVGRFYGVPTAEARFERLDDLEADWAAQLGTVALPGLTPAARIDYVLLRDHLGHEQAERALNRRRVGEMDPLLPFRGTIVDLELARRRMQTIDAQAAAARVAAMPEQIKQLRARIDKGRKAGGKAGAAATQPAAATAPTDPASTQPATAPSPAAAPAAAPAADAPQTGPVPAAQPADDALAVSPVLALRTASAVGELRRALGDWSHYYEGYQPDFSWWLKAPREAAEKALDEYAKFLREEIAGVKGEPTDPLVGDPVGEEALLADLRGEFIAYTPQELISIGERELAWCEDQMRKAAAEMGFGDDWKAALARVKEAHVPPGAQSEYVRDVGREAIDFLKQHDLISIPPLCEELWRTEMLSPDAQKTLPFAVYGGGYMGVAYASQSMPHEDKLMSMRGNNRHFTRIVTPHELIPGHHLQGFYAARVRPYRRLFSTPFFVEGWALYWEMRLWELGWGRCPEDRVGMLFWRMHRAARIIVSLKFHLGQMTPQEMVDFLVDRVGHERLGATGEVRRFIGGDYSPLYQCGYMIGGLQIRALHRELVESGKMTERQFHDALLTYGPIPIELIRAGLTGAELTREAKPSWRFAGEPATGAGQ